MKMNHHTQTKTGKELLFAALRHEPLTAIPWVPFAGVHAGSLKGYTARQILTDKTKLLESLLEVNRQYDPDGQPIVFDLQIEAEILGCELGRQSSTFSRQPSPVTKSRSTKPPARKDRRAPADGFGYYGCYESSGRRSHCVIWVGHRAIYTGFSPSRN
jgi:uroporphyrinogen decarboxylase